MSPRAVAVAAEGLRMAQLLEAKPAFLHVGGDTASSREALARVLGEAAGKTEGGLPAELLVRNGEPYAAISGAAVELNADLIVLGALRRDPLLIGIWGSVARRVARRSPCSVLMLSDPKPHRTVGDVVVASVKPDASSFALVRFILEMAGRGGIRMAHFVSEFSVSEAHWAVGGTLARPMTFDDFVKTRLAAERAMLADFISDFDLQEVGVRVASLASLAGREGTEIINYAQEQHADLLVLPAPRKRMGLFDRFFQDPVELAMRRLTGALFVFRSRGS
jgi:nucleotide-binding universal stress UspA family protein